MEVRLVINNKNYKCFLEKPQDISISVGNDCGPNAFYAPSFKSEPVRAGDFVGSTSEGGPVNFCNVFINPHGNGTHTECVGHISDRGETLPSSLVNFHFSCCLISLEPQATNEGLKVISKGQLEEHEARFRGVESIAIRTLPNEKEKLNKNYSGTNPPYVEPEALHYIRAQGVKHLLIDLPSVDPEVDGGKLLGHKAFWNYPEEEDEGCTITEMIYVPEEIKDGLFLLNLQITSIELDASPSKPVLFQLYEYD